MPLIWKRDGDAYALRDSRHRVWVQVAPEASDVGWRITFAASLRRLSLCEASLPQAIETAEDIVERGYPDDEVWFCQSCSLDGRLSRLVFFPELGEQDGALLIYEDLFLSVEHMFDPDPAQERFVLCEGRDMEEAVTALMAHADWIVADA